MRIELVDPYGNSYAITSSDPETLGRWLLETFTKVQVDRRDGYWRAMVWPSVRYTEPGNWEMDWIADTRVLTLPMTVKSPADLLNAMALQIKEAEGLRDD